LRGLHDRTQYGPRIVAQWTRNVVAHEQVKDEFARVGMRLRARTRSQAEALRELSGTSLIDTRMLAIGARVIA
jgi:hypothetical protein